MHQRPQLGRSYWACCFVFCLHFALSELFVNQSWIAITVWVKKQKQDFLYNVHSFKWTLLLHLLLVFDWFSLQFVQSCSFSNWLLKVAKFQWSALKLNFLDQLHIIMAAVTGIFSFYPSLTKHTGLKRYKNQVWHSTICT